MLFLGCACSQKNSLSINSSTSSVVAKDLPRTPKEQALFLSDEEKPTDIKPNLSFSPSIHLITSFSPPYPALREEERKTDWGKELYLAQAFAKELDLFRASTAFKRARILSAGEEIDTARKNQIEYGLVLCYWLSNKYEEVVEIFENRRLEVSQKTFPPYQSLLVILYDSYLKLGEKNKASNLLKLAKSLPPLPHDQNLEKKLELYTAFLDANVDALYHKGPKTIQNAMQDFQNQRKSPFKAGLYNAILPGAGYLYVGQKQTALTSFLLNTLFIAATCQFATHGQTAAAIITGGFELGWYVGGIRGANEAAKQYNSTLYNLVSKELLVKEKLFPLLMIDYAF